MIGDGLDDVFRLHGIAFLALEMGAPQSFQKAQPAHARQPLPTAKGDGR